MNATDLISLLGTRLILGELQSAILTKNGMKRIMIAQ